MPGVRGRSVRWPVLGVVGALLVTGCGGHDRSPRPHTLVFDVTGQGTLSSLTYTIDGRATGRKSVGLPWHQTFRLPARKGGHKWDLTAKLDSGSVYVEVYLDGARMSSGGCAGDGCDSGGSGSTAD
ncbi:hypothetical protein GCM10023191_070510 [Actinoallomurus oryzae]|uniref:Uncharacterized protein n=1 Tax=Actinoallomurus oryzae TaxID=502180 RepID=A0ABP8QSS5_9ACTN